MRRRGFMAGILAAGVAPAFVGARVLMPVRQLVGTSGQVLVSTGDGFEWRQKPLDDHYPWEMDRVQIDRVIRGEQLLRYEQEFVGVQRGPVLLIHQTVTRMNGVYVAGRRS